MTDRAIVRLGGLALAGGALAFMAVFAYLAASFNYPDVLDGPADAVLPSLLATGSPGRVAWAIYAFLPLIWLPASAGAYQVLGRERAGAMRLAVLFAVVAAMAMMLGLMRWRARFQHVLPPDSNDVATRFTTATVGRLARRRYGCGGARGDVP